MVNVKPLGEFKLRKETCVKIIGLIYCHDSVIVTRTVFIMPHKCPTFAAHCSFKIDAILSSV